MNAGRSTSPGYVVVLFSFDQCAALGAPDGMRCVMEVHGPFTREEADRFADDTSGGAVEGGFIPHVLRLTTPARTSS